MVSSGLNHAVNTEIEMIKPVRGSEAFFLSTFLLLLVFLVDPSRKWISNAQVHIVLEAGSAVMACLVGGVALLFYWAERRRLLFCIGITFLGTGILDGCHALFTCSWFADYWSSPPESYIPWSWLASRVFFAGSLLFFVAADPNLASKLSLAPAKEKLLL